MTAGKTLAILLAEDNGGDVFLVRRALEEHAIPHTLEVVPDGARAIDLIGKLGEEKPCPDLFLLDLNLPSADGHQVLREFRRHPRCQSTPVIVVSSSDAPGDKAAISKLGIAGYFRKPSGLDEFMKLGEVIRGVMSAGDRSGTLTGSAGN